ncbi:MAG TPA: hypothetical protein VGJ87_23760, partial [Roseiflexaceae bacterium]
NPVGIAGLAGASGFVQGLIEGPFGLTIVAACAISVLVRFRRAQGIERQQIKWFAYAAGVLIVVGTLGTFLPFLPGLLKDVLFTFAVGSLPVAVGIAILRYRLYDIDLIIRRTLVYGVLTAVLALVYLGSVVLLQVIFRALTGETSQAAIVASTLAIAALFTPLRRRIQTTIDRRFYRRKYDAAKTLAAFSAQLRDEVDLNALTGELLAVIAETIQPAHVSLWLREAPHRSSRDPKITRA